MKWPLRNIHRQLSTASCLYKNSNIHVVICKKCKRFRVTHVPVLSTVTERTPPWWQSILARASFWLGDQRVTVPLWWPRWMMALWGFWHITSSRPVLVQMAATSFPTDTSRYCRKLVALWRREREQEALTHTAPGGNYGILKPPNVFSFTES